MNFILRSTRIVNNLFSRVVAVNYTEANKIHSLCSQTTFKFGENKQLGSSFSESILQPRLPILNQFCGMKYKVCLRLRCKGCYFVTRKETMYVMCKLKPRHKQSNFQKKPKNAWIYTHTSQSKRRGY